MNTTATPPMTAATSATRSEEAIDATVAPRQPAFVEAPRRPRLPDWTRSRVLAALTGVLLAATLFATSAFHMSYDVIAPGSADGLAGVIKVTSNDAAHPIPTYVPRGAFMFTTVSISERINAFQALWAEVDSNVDLIQEQRITGGQPSQIVQQINRADMDESKVNAEVVALRRLGYSVGIHGDGALIVQDIGAKVLDGTIQRGDVITAVDGKPVSVRDDVGTIMAGKHAGDTVRLTLRNGSSARDVTVTTHPEAKTGRPLIGVQIATANFRYDLPLDIKIDTGLVGGPSAGLAFTLGLLDVLTPGDLTAGRKIAVTGTIDIDEAVGQIGGVGQKAVAARRAGAYAFLVPAGEERAARKHAGSMLVIPVHNLTEALAALQRLGGTPLPAK